MSSQAEVSSQTLTSNKTGAPPASLPEYPVREYIGAMTLELAQMARWDGDEVLGALLDAAADRANAARSARSDMP